MPIGEFSEFGKDWLKDHLFPSTNSNDLEEIDIDQLEDFSAEQDLTYTNIDHEEEVDNSLPQDMSGDHSATDEERGPPKVQPPVYPPSSERSNVTDPAEANRLGLVKHDGHFYVPSIPDSSGKMGRKSTNSSSKLKGSLTKVSPSRTKPITCFDMASNSNLLGGQNSSSVPFIHPKVVQQRVSGSGAPSSSTGAMGSTQSAPYSSTFNSVAAPNGVMSSTNSAHFAQAQQLQQNFAGSGDPNSSLGMGTNHLIQTPGLQYAQAGSFNNPQGFDSVVEAKVMQILNNMNTTSFQQPWNNQGLTNASTLGYLPSNQSTNWPPQQYPSGQGYVANSTAYSAAPTMSGLPINPTPVFVPPQATVPLTVGPGNVSTSPGIHSQSPQKDSSDSEDDSSEEESEALDVDLGSPFWAGMRALTMVNEDMRLFLMGDSPPQLYHIKPSQCKVSRFGLIFKKDGQEFIFPCEDVFVGSLDGKMYVAVKDNCKDCRFLELNLEYVPRLPERKDMDWPKVRHLTSLFGKYSNPCSNPPILSTDLSGKFEIKLQDSLNLDELSKNHSKANSVLKNVVLRSAHDSDQKILGCLGGPALDENSHKLDNHQSDLTASLSKEVRSKDSAKRANALASSLALASIKEVDKALKDFVISHPEHQAFASSLRGPTQIALSALSPVVSRSLAEVKAQKEFMRKQATSKLDRVEAAVIKSLMEEDIWSTSLFASNSEEVVKDSQRAPALRELKVQKTFNKETRDSRHYLSKLSKSMKAGKRSNSNKKAVKFLKENSMINKSLPQENNSELSSQSKISSQAEDFDQAKSSYDSGRQPQPFRGRGRGRGSFNTYNPKRGGRGSRGGQQ